MGVSDGMEDVMDEETRKALDMSREELVERAAKAKAARIAKKIPRRLRGRRVVNQRTGAVVEEATERAGAVEDAIVLKWNPESVTIVALEWQARQDLPVTIRPRDTVIIR
jgi:hypothetical protein